MKLTEMMQVHVFAGSVRGLPAQDRDVADTLVDEVDHTPAAARDVVQIIAPDGTNLEVQVKFDWRYFEVELAREYLQVQVRIHFDVEVIRRNFEVQIVREDLEVAPDNQYTPVEVARRDLDSALVHSLEVDIVREDHEIETVRGDLLELLLWAASLL